MKKVTATLGLLVALALATPATAGGTTTPTPKAFSHGMCIASGTGRQYVVCNGQGGGRLVYRYPDSDFAGATYEGQGNATVTIKGHRVVISLKGHDGVHGEIMVEQVWLYS